MSQTQPRRHGLWRLLALASSAACALADPAHATTVTGSNSNALGIPDGNPIGALSDIVFTDTGTLNDLSVMVAMDHSKIGDLTLTLSNGSTSVVLMDQVDDGDDTDDFSSAFPITFSASGASKYDLGNSCFGGVIGSSGSGNCVTTHFQPWEAFSSLFGQPLAGVWTLRVQDHAAGNVGQLSAWSLTADVTSPVPVPSSIGMMALGLAALGGAARRHQRRTWP